MVAASTPLFDAVVIGASAGAVEALSVLLPPLPRDLAVSVIVVVHLSARVPSLLPELFASKCAAPVREPVDKEAVGSGTIWFAPASYHLLIEPDKTFSLSIDEPVNFSRPSIDVLFESAAVAYGPRLLALVLTCASRDGCQGAVLIRRAGGFVAVQEPSTAVAPALPSLVVAQASPQKIGTITELAALLLECVGGAKS